MKDSKLTKSILCSLSISFHPYIGYLFRCSQVSPKVFTVFLFESKNKSFPEIKGISGQY